MKQPFLIGWTILTALILSPQNVRADWVAACDQELLKIASRIAKDAVSIRLLRDRGAKNVWEGQPENEALCGAILFDPACDSPGIAMWRERLALQGIFIIKLEPRGKFDHRMRAIQIHAALVRYFPEHATFFNTNLQRELSRLPPHRLIQPALPWAQQDHERSGINTLALFTNCGERTTANCAFACLHSSR